MKSRIFNLTILSGAIASAVTMVHMPPTEAAPVPTAQVDVTQPGAVAPVNDAQTEEGPQQAQDNHATDDQNKQNHDGDQDKQHDNSDHPDTDDDDDEDDDDDGD